VLVMLLTLLVTVTVVLSTVVAALNTADRVVGASCARDRRTVLVPLVGWGRGASGSHTNIAEDPAAAVTLAGWVVIVGALLTVRVAALLLTLPALLATVTVN